jgi:hypothetical protein
MGALARQLAELWHRVVTHDTTSEPEDLYNGRPMTSLFESLSAEQKARLLAYQGHEDHGDPSFKRKDS